MSNASEGSCEFDHLGKVMSIRSLHIKEFLSILFFHNNFSPNGFSIH